VSLGLEQSERKLLIGAGVLPVLLVVISVLVSPPQEANGAGGPSSYSASWGGTKAGYLLLQRLGYQVHRWENPPQELLDEGDEESEKDEVLILAEPMQAPSSEDKTAIRMFLQRGGTVLATGSSAAKFLPEATSFGEADPFSERVSFHPVAVSPLMHGAPDIKMAAQHWVPESKSSMVVYGNEESAAVVTIAVGKGQVIWWADSFPMTNGGLRQANDVELFLNSVGDAEGRTVYWDEYFHGVQNSLWTYLAKTPAPWGIAQIGIVFLAVILTYSRRQGPIRVPQTGSRLSPLEFVETLGDLYHAAHAGTTAVRILFERLRFQLQRNLGLPANASAKELAQTASETLRWNKSELTEVLEKSEQAKRGNVMEEKECLSLVKQLYAYSKKLEAGKNSDGERTQG